MLDKKTNFFKNQFRMADNKKIKETKVIKTEVVETTIATTSYSGSNALEPIETLKVVDINATKKIKLSETLKIKEFVKQFYELGIKKVLLYFVVFIAIGRGAEMLIPQEWIMTLFSGDKMFSTFLSATIGLPLYVSGSAALPLMKSMMNSGAGQGVLLAFLITGKATGVPVIAGMATILKKRAILFYVLFVYIGGIVLGLAYQMILNLL